MKTIEMKYDKKTASYKADFKRFKKNTGSLRSHFKRKPESAFVDVKMASGMTFEIPIRS